MSLRFYAKFAIRSLMRGGQRTVLAGTCVAIGVMAIVGLQLVTGMVYESIKTNARAVNQGDVTVQAQAVPLQAEDLSAFRDLRERGAIRAYTQIASSGGIIQQSGGRRKSVTIRGVDPTTFPLVGDARLTSGTSATLHDALVSTNAAVITKPLADALAIREGTTLRIFTTNGQILQVTVAGITASENPVWTGNVVTVSLDTWQSNSRTPTTFQSVSVVIDGKSGSKGAADALRVEFPLASVRTPEDVLRQAAAGVETTRRFLVLIGLLALTLGGVGIVNTMQVLLLRRRVEIAVLKTVGYRRLDLYGLFGVEAALLGLVGGMSGAGAGVGVAWLLRRLFMRAFPITFAFSVDPGIVFGGIIIGVATTVIFGLLPIVRAAAIRPHAVLTEVPEPTSDPSFWQSAFLLLLLSALFSALTSVILGSAIWGLVTVYAAFVLFSALSAGLGALLWLASRLPIPDRFTLTFASLLLAVTATTALLLAVPLLRGVGFVMLAGVVCVCLVLLLPRGGRSNVRIAVRNVGRNRARGTGTVLALCVGVFAVGLVLSLGQDIRANLGDLVTSKLDYNLIAVVPASSAPDLESTIHGLPGLLAYRSGDVSSGTPTEVDGTPVASRIVRDGTGPTPESRRQLSLLSGIQGFQLTSGDVPPNDRIVAGRNLTGSDAATANVVGADSLRREPLQLHVGSTVTLRSLAGSTQTLTLVGFYRQAEDGPPTNFTLAPLLGPQALAAGLGGPVRLRAHYVRIQPGKSAAAGSKLEDQAPDAIVIDLEEFLTQFQQIFNNILLMLTALASLALLAGVAIVANAVALAMLERRRELAILKAVGYSSRQVLGAVVIENALMATLGSVAGMMLVALGVRVFSRLAGVAFGVGTMLSISIITGVIALTVATTVAVAWHTVNVRPLGALRYE